MKRLLLIVSLILCTSAAAIADDRIASDFELRAAREQLAASRTALDRLASHLNLGDTLAARGEIENARASYRLAASIAHTERLASSAAGDLRQQATFTAYEGLAAARLGRRTDAFALLEEAVRFVKDSPRLWNLYASAMQAAGMRSKAVTAARNAATLSDPETTGARATGDELDHLIHVYALAAALDGGDSAEREEAEILLETVVSALDSPAFATLRRQAADREQFEVFSTARGDVSAFLSLRARSKQRLAKMVLPDDPARAAAVYRSMLADRSDDASALAGLAQVTRAVDEKRDAFAAAFDANPLSIPLIRDYESFLDTATDDTADGASTGSLMRRAIQMVRQRSHDDAGRDLDQLSRKFPASEAVLWLRARSLRDRGRTAEARAIAVRLSSDLRRDLERDAEPRSAIVALSPTPSAEELRAVVAILRGGGASPEELRHLDDLVLRCSAVLDEVTNAGTQTIASSGSVEGVPFRFAEPLVFNGTFSAGEALHLDFRISGAARDAQRGDTLLIEPVRISR